MAFLQKRNQGEMVETLEMVEIKNNLNENSKALQLAKCQGHKS